MKKVHLELEEEEDMGKYIFKNTLIFVIFFSSYILYFLVVDLINIHVIGKMKMHMENLGVIF